LGDDLLKVMTSSFQRPNPKSCFVETKTVGHYTNSILATTEAKRNGYDEALLMDMNGFVAEGPVANFFYEKNGILFTCPPGNILLGITRNTIMELAKQINIKVVEKYFTIEEVKTADAAFFTGTAAEVSGIQSLDKYQFPVNWDDSLGFRLSEAYQDIVKQPIKHSNHKAKYAIQ
jgi:branched-chain amino acid aminotransferase